MKRVPGPNPRRVALLDHVLGTKGVATRTPRASCPKCNLTLDVMAHPSGGRPRPHDLSICAECGTYLQLDATLMPRELTPDAFRLLEPEARQSLLEARAQWEVFQGRRNGSA